MWSAPERVNITLDNDKTPLPPSTSEIEPLQFPRQARYYHFSQFSPVAAADFRLFYLK